MSRFARDRRIFFVEEAEYRDVAQPVMHTSVCAKTGVRVTTPYFPDWMRGSDTTSTLRTLVAELIDRENIRDYVAWFYTPMALDFAADITPDVTVYDCMDELSLFRGASPRLVENERELFRRCDLVFTGGASLFESKRPHHPHVYAFPSGVDVNHFLQARSIREPLHEQAGMSRPRIGYAGVIDERMDIDLIRRLPRDGRTGRSS